MRMIDWSSDVCSSELPRPAARHRFGGGKRRSYRPRDEFRIPAGRRHQRGDRALLRTAVRPAGDGDDLGTRSDRRHETAALSCPRLRRSEEHTSELQSLMRISYAVFCLNKKTNI